MIKLEEILLLLDSYVILNVLFFFSSSCRDSLTIET